MALTAGLQRSGLVLSGLLLSAGLALLLAMTPETPDSRMLSQALFSLSPGDDARTQVGLPQSWQEACRDCVMAWYEFSIAPPQEPRQPMAIYLPGVGQNAALYFNGEFLGQAGNFQGRSGRHHADPLLFPIASSLWRVDDNLMFVLLRAEPSTRGFLPAPWLGPQDKLATLHTVQTLLRQAAVRFLGLASLVLGLVLALIWAKRPAEQAYGWLAVGMISWAVAQMGITVTAPPLQLAAWDPLLSAAATAAPVALIGFVLHVMQLEARRLRHGAFLLLVMAAATTAFDPGGYSERVTGMLIHSLYLLVGILLVQDGWRGQTGLRRWLLLPGVALVALALQDVPAVLATPVFHYSPALAVAVPLLMVAFTWILLGRFIRSLEMAELLNIDLDRLVREKTSALEAQFERVQALEREKVIISERERLMRDMHDGIGGHLVSTLAMLEKDGQRESPVGSAVQGALDDLRLMIDSLDPVEGDLTVVLAMFRDRVEPRLRSADIRLQWRVDDLPELAYLGPSSVLSILRILQECVTNVLKHARASQLVVEAKVGDEAVSISVIDNGRGFDVTDEGAGRGLKNLRHRAQALGGELRIDSSCTGTTTLLVLPFDNRAGKPDS